MASSLVIIKGSSTNDATRLFQNLFKNYIEETTISSIILTRQAQSAELSSGGVFVGLESQPQHTSSIDTVQHSALMSFNSMENDLSEISTGSGNQVSTYTIQEGDTLSFIASDFGVSMNTIIWANNLTNINTLKLGTELKIPPVNGVIHKVKKGDTIVTIAKKYSADEARIIEFNVLPKDGYIQINDEIIVPDGKITAPKTATPTKSTPIARFAYLPDLSSYFMIPTSGHNWGSIHGRNGVDIASACGTTVYAAADGTAAIVDAAGWNGGFGKYIKLVHANGTETLYAHNSKVLISQGEVIAKGQKISLMGTTGRSTGCHLHFEVHGARNPLAKY
ncbi:MAG: M23 family metallopeptidase [bacterium]|nr:M23 family metallopeptidase [bacterium]